MTSEEPSRRPPGHKPGDILHQTRTFPYSPYKITLAGVVIICGLWYFTLYTKKKPEATAGEVARVAAGVAEPEERK